MDLAAIRADLADGAKAIGYNAWDYEPDDPQDLPAAVIGGLKTATRLNRIVTEFELAITFYVSTADTLDGTRKLDTTLSIGVEDGTSFLDWLDAVQDGAGQSWRSVRFLSAGPYTRVQLPGSPGPVALACEIALELTA